MAITFTNDSASISTTEYYLASDSTTPTYQTTDGIYQLFLDLNALAAGDQFRVRLYEKYDSGGTARLVEEWILSGAQSKPGWISPAFTLGEGWEWSILRLAGSDRTIPWSIRKIA
jgi:hypothetical protein